MTPDEYLKLPKFWQDWGIIAQQAEAIAEKEQQRNATNKSKNSAQNK